MYTDILLMSLSILVGILIGLYAMYFINRKNRDPRGNYDAGHKQGYIDAYIGKKTYTLQKNENGETLWMINKIEENNTSQ